MFNNSGRGFNLGGWGSRGRVPHEGYMRDMRTGFI